MTGIPVVQVTAAMDPKALAALDTTSVDELPYSLQEKPVGLTAIWVEQQNLAGQVHPYSTKIARDEELARQVEKSIESQPDIPIQAPTQPLGSSPPQPELEFNRVWFQPRTTDLALRNADFGTFFVRLSSQANCLTLVYKS